MTDVKTDSPQPETGAERRDAKPSLLKSARFWLPAGIIVALLITAGVVIAVLNSVNTTVAPGTSAFTQRLAVVQDSLQAAMPLATQAKDQILAGQSEEAKVTVAELSGHADRAVRATDTELWRSGEEVPVIGENLKAARLAAEAVSTLSHEVLAPATEVSLSSLKPVDGAFDLASLAALQPIVAQAASAAESVNEGLQTLDQSQLIGPLRDGVVKLQDAVTELTEMAEPAGQVLQLLPGMLGADGPRNYLLMFPNNAEIRAGGGNPAALAIITADGGSISMTQQASSGDFGWESLPINPETEALYGSRVKQQMQDVTYTPYFHETAELMRGFWASSFGTPVDAVVSFDPVALSYLLEATGPVTLETGDVITAENAVSLMLNEVYFKYTDPRVQDAFFASAAESIFGALTAGSGDTRALVDALAKAADEGRLMYSSYDQTQMDLIGTTRIAGPLPADNSEDTVLGVFFNYVLAAKMDYYVDSSVVGATTQCTVDGGGPATFSATATLTNILTPAEAARLPGYVVASNGGGDIYREVAFYGPVGTVLQSVEVNGTMVEPLGRWGNTYREMTHDGRPVVQVPMLVHMQETADVTVTFAAAEGQSADSFGPFDVRATPTVRTTPVEVSTPGCD